jgi:hypothetical protein
LHPPTAQLAGKEETEPRSELLACHEQSIAHQTTAAILGEEGS